MPYFASRIERIMVALGGTETQVVQAILSVGPL